MADTTYFRNGFTFKFKGDIYQITSFQHVKPGKGGAFVRTKLKNVLTGRVIDNTFRAGEKVEEVRLEKRNMQFLYREGELNHFMDNNTYEQITFSSDRLPDQKKYMKEGMTISVYFTDGNPLMVEIPQFVELSVKQTVPGFKGDTATSATKPATLETGAEIDVPLFINEGDVLKIDTETDSYLERVDKS